MRSLIDRLTRLSLRFKWITLAITFTFIAAGIYSYTQLNQELVPDIDFPQTFMVAQNGGANSDNILHMYAVPLEERAEEVDGVVNVETTSREGFFFGAVRNEFGLDQDQVVDELQKAIDDIPLPVRRLEPPARTTTPQQMIGELSPEALLWLQDYADQNNQAFRQQLSTEVWRSFSATALQGVPVSFFDNLQESLRNELLAKRGDVPEEGVPTDWSQDIPPALPLSWQQNDARFKDTSDLAEMAIVRNLADLFNDFVDDGYVVGPLGDTSDLLAADIRVMAAIEDNCRASYEGEEIPLNFDGSDRCSLFSYLINNNAIAALSEEAYAALPQEIRESHARDPQAGAMPLPDAWRVEGMELVTFTFADIPLASVSISSASLPSDELRRLIEDDLIPRLKELDNVANVTALGGETYQLVAVDQLISGENTSCLDSICLPATASSLILPEITTPPALPPSWQRAAAFLEGVEKLDTAADIPLREDTNGSAETEASRAYFINNLALDPSGQGQNLIAVLSPDVWLYMAQNEDDFWNRIVPAVYQVMSIDSIAAFPEIYAFVPERVELPDEPITRLDESASLQLTIFKKQGSNTVEAWDETEAFLDEWIKEHSDKAVQSDVAFEQASFIEESIQGVTDDGTRGALLAVIVILVFMNLSIRSTLVISISIPASVMSALVLMNIIPSNIYAILAPILEDAGRESTFGSILVVIIRLFPETYTLNIMTLSGLTVAVGRVVDDSIVVLENIYRNIQKGENQREAILHGTREVSIAILAATITTMFVFLPLGLFGGVTGAFFLPFGLAVVYSLVGSYLVAVTTVPALSYVLITKASMPEEGLIPITPEMTAYEKGVKRLKNVFIGSVDSLGRLYARTITSLLSNTITRLLTIAVAIGTLIFGMALLGSRPQTFLPDFGEPEITVSIDLPAQYDDKLVTIDQTDTVVRELESFLRENGNGNGVVTVQTSIGGDAQQFDTRTDEVDGTEAIIRIRMATSEDLDSFLPELREQAEAILNARFPATDGSGSDYVTVSGVNLAGGGFNTFSMELTGKTDEVTLAQLREYNTTILDILNKTEGLVNVETTLSGLGSGESTYLRIDGNPAVQYTAELESDDTLGVTQAAISDVEDAIEKFQKEAEATPGENTLAEVEVGPGFDSEQQQEGFIQIFVSMGIATLIVYLILAITFGSLVHPLTILVSLPLSVVGAGVALTVTDRVLSLSSLIGLLMLIGIVVSNGVVLIDRVQQNRRQKKMTLRDSLVEAASVRMRPILMTSITTILGVFPLALGLTEGAIIAAELGTVVVGGLVSSTLLTLLVLPVVYSLFADLITLISRPFKRNKPAPPAVSSATD